MALFAKPGRVEAVRAHLALALFASALAACIQQPGTGADAGDESAPPTAIVDGGAGFGDAIHTAQTVKMMERAGACGIEIEDQIAPKRAHHHKDIEHLISIEEMTGKLKAAQDARTDENFVVIARCNAVMVEIPVERTEHDGACSQRPTHGGARPRGMCPTSHSRTTLAAIDAALGLPAPEATSLLTWHQWREVDVALLQAAAARLRLRAYLASADSVWGGGNPAVWVVAG